jgi:hypothetical protein
VTVEAAPKSGLLAELLFYFLRLADTQSYDVWKLRRTYFTQTHEVIFFTRKCCTTSLAAKLTAIFTDGGRHANRSLNSRSGAVSLSRVKAMMESA